MEEDTERAEDEVRELQDAGFVAYIVGGAVRDPALRLGASSAVGEARIDFAKLRRAQRKPTGWLLGRLLEGERPVRVTAAIRSSGGNATVDVERVEALTVRSAEFG